MTCRNIIERFCNENVHNIIEKMGQGRFSDHYIGGHLFDCCEYRIFEGQVCIQYLQEYVPLHLPQIEHVLSAVMRESSDLLNNPVNIMDLGSGPATVPLAFCRLSKFNQHRYKLKITTVEPSDGFNVMINIFKATNANRSIEIVKTLKYKLFEDNFMNDESVFRIGYNWIIIANSISAIGRGRAFREVNDILGRFVVNVLRYSEKVILTIIESSSRKYFNIRGYLSEIENIGFNDLEIIKTIVPINYELQTKHEVKRYIQSSEVYKTHPGYPRYSPYINSKSLLLELR
jgi:hypothetical protein